METDSGSFIQKLKDKLNIVDVIGDYVSLQRKGRDFWACCPFHHEKTPSFQVKTFHQCYVCYGCGKKGDVINFVMEMDKLSFGEALEKLAHKAGLEVPERAIDVKFKKQKELLEKIYAINREAALFYHNNLKKEEGKNALIYLAERQFTSDTIKKFGLGYSADYTSLVNYLIQKGYSVDSMKAAGVIGLTDDGRTYDFFAKRLIIPIISAQGKVIGFSGRSLEKKPNHAKYKNTSTTLAFNKGKNLFAINMFKQYVPSGIRSMILVEGHLDVISLFQAGIKNVVASMGTALTPEQCKEIKKFADIVYVSYDGDSAGEAATIKGLSLLKNEGLEVKVVELTGGLDPDDFVKKFGKDEYLKLVDKALPLVDFKLKKIDEKYSFDSFDEKVKYLKEAVVVLKELDKLERAVYIEKVSKVCGLSQDKILASLENERTPITDLKNPQIPASKNRTENAMDIAEKFIISSMIFGKNYAYFGDVKKEYFENEGYINAIDYINRCASEGKMPIASQLYDIMEKADADAIIGATDVIKVENQANFYKESVEKLYKRFIDREIKNTAANLSKETDEQLKEELRKKLVMLTQMKK